MLLGQHGRIVLEAQDLVGRVGPAQLEIHGATDLARQQEAGVAPLLMPGRDRVLHRGRRLAELGRSEEHTSELQSLMRISYAVFCLNKTNQIKTQEAQR